MRPSRNTLQLTLFMVGLSAVNLTWVAAQTPSPSPSPKSEAYLFSYFTRNGEDGLHLASSHDGLHFTPLREGRSFLAPTLGGKLMRDPSIVEGPDGVHHLVWTTGWWDRGIGLAHSKDLIQWSTQEWLPVMEHEPTALNAWAPEIFYDRENRQYLILWASTIPGRFPETEAFGDEVKDKGFRLNHRIYFVTTRDFKEYSPTRLFYDGGFNVIDATLVQDGLRYALIVKDETRWPVPKKNLRVAYSARAEGPFGDLSGPVSPDWVEGPSVLRIADTWILFYDEYTRRRYGASRSNDLRRFDIISPEIQFPKGARHGTVFRTRPDVLAALLASTAAKPIK